MRHGIAVPVAALLVAGVAACTRAKDVRPEETAAAAPATVAAPAAAPAAESGGAAAAGGALATREEAQDHFDQARRAFLEKDMPGAATHLRAGAAFISRRADSVSGNAKAKLQASARDLEALAAAADRKAVTSEKVLDDAFARANFAEAARHQADAAAAWAKQDAARTGAELTMTADHFERAAKDAGVSLDAGAQRALTDVRAMAEKLMRGAAVAGTDMEQATAALGREMAKLDAKLPRGRA